MSSRSLSAFVVGCALSLLGCNSLLGDFKYDPNAGKGGNGSGGNGSGGSGMQGDILVMPSDGLITTEQGAKATFSIVLKRPPTDTVTIALSSSKPEEGLVNPLSVSFTQDNFSAPQMVQVVGVDDDLPDGTQEYEIRTSKATSSDDSYHGFDPIDPKLKNVDDETAGFTLMPPNGLVTTESGGEAKFTLVLNHAPTAPVTVPLSSSDPGEGTVTPEMLTFTPENWMAPQTATVTGVNDDEADGPQAYEIVTGPASSADGDYQLLDPDNAQITNQDNDSAGVTLMPAAGLLTSEAGAMTSFGIVLNSPPQKDVVIALSSSNESEGTVTPKSVTFTELNWMAPQAVTVTGVDDERFDGNQPYFVLTDPAQSDDLGYAALDPPDASVTNVDDDSPSLLVTPQTGLITSETGDSASFTVALNSKPAGDVLLDVVSNREEEGLVTPPQLTFTEQNWKAPQLVTVTGQDDDVADGMQLYTVHVRPNPMSADNAYASLLEVDVGVSNTDDDSAGITVNAAGVLTTAERGDSALFTVVLNSKPTNDVTIALSSSNSAEGTVSPAKLVFTPANWAAPQTVTIKGVDDAVADGDQPYRIITEAAVSDDLGYRDMNPANVDVTNVDNDSPGITVRTANPTLSTTEGGGTATFTVVLNSQPRSPVTIRLSSNAPTEGTVSPETLLFTQANWNAPQTVTIKGQNDDVADGAQPYRIVLAPAQSLDANYEGRDANDVNVNNVDDDSAGIRLIDAQNLSTSEAGDTATFQVVLNSKPTADVQLALSSNRPSEGSVAPATLTFTSANWSAPQTVTVTGVNDDVADGNQTFRILTAPATSQDTKYRGIDPNNPQVTNVDNDSPGITVKYTPAAGLSTSEQGGSATFTVVLNSQPTADVTLRLRSSNVKEGTISPSSLIFTAANWAAPRTVTISGVDDKVADGAQPYTVITDPATSDDPKYATLDAIDVPVSNVDNDSAGITVSNPTGNTNENGSTASFTVVLNSEPKANVSVSLSSSDATEGSISPSSLTFTPLDWSAPQKITVTGKDDKVADGAQPYTIEIAAATSDDAGYQGIDPRDVTLSNVDDDSAGITVSAVKGDTTEAGITTSFTIVLNSQPTADVQLPISSSNEAEGTVSAGTVTFTDTDWAAPHTVTITGADDESADGKQPYSIVIGAANSADENYDGLDAPDVAVFNVDNDSAGFLVSETSGTTSEGVAGRNFTFTVALTSKPSANVSVHVSSSDTTEATVSPAMLTFTSLNWSTKQTVTVTGVNDDVADGAQPYTVRLAAATSTDANYSELDPPDVAMSNTDNDSAGIDVSLAAGNTSEAGTNTTFSIVLRSEPAAPVTIPLSSSDETEGTLTVMQVVFTPDNWSTAQNVTVHGENDAIADGSQPYVIRLGAATSDDDAYSGIDPDDVNVTNVDDDMAGITISAISGPTNEAGGTATFTIKLDSQPTSPVSIPIVSSNTDEGVLQVQSIEFTTANWNTEQEITVTGVDDELVDGPKLYLLEIGPATSVDQKYDGLNPTDLAVQNLDDDEP